MDAGEPDLADPFVLDARLVRIELPGREPVRSRAADETWCVLRPAPGPGRRASPANGRACAWSSIGHIHLLNAAGHFVDRHAVGGNRVPDPDEVNFFDRAIVGRVVILRQTDIADRAEEILDVPESVIPLAPILPVGGVSFLVEFRFALGRHQALIEHETYDDADRKGTPAETKSVDVIVRVAKIAAGKFVNFDYVAFQAITECAAENGQRLERRGADAVVIERDLVGAGEIKRLEGSPDVGAPHLRRGLHIYNLSIAEYCARFCKNNYTKKLEWLCIFDSPLIDSKILHSVLSSQNKSIIIVAAGGSHIEKMNSFLESAGGYEKVTIPFSAAHMQQSIQNNMFVSGKRRSNNIRRIDRQSILMY